ncbi:multifunctional oxoglutarate decarboxylase/oxoglutarate dehydrogenase thiamine pyrophosphate-binding subunit/dihydrolipoyllysine-residue succinyltransferase subunit [Propioniciclava sinopodophylli]|uniref:multifunctional oxoglutarate decarboxylase/oxoglutarate dehydrogenase thiamine pyrophosphate-binding subunit/dihydrolipoyllysine-residue succinyltransferase subunit n=1 Tax=Propioniciclava sinopodophylli TaxID=1837344 RepID=UPI00249346D1|nr:multifunctional oxoglutarate decarboxylase/oxoglutarate dehydrogenase thiamine pyrophosphate-binding subunit/dihydrolipoyllysine-residue succinyltransferase subunit [Propioniciclava sinopodophylli]
MVATAPGNNSNDDLSNFGANDWLIEEMFEAYTKDPNAVDQSWREFFASRAGQSTPAPAAAQPAASAPPAPAKKEAPQQAAPAAPAPAPKAAEAAPQKPATEPQASAPAPRTTSPAPQPRTETSTRPKNPGSAGGLSANRPSAVRKIETSAEPTRTVMRGAPMRTAKNMDLSLSIPTATSVRHVPMKLIIEQRDVINKHLARTTGGKVSFTHLLGYAMVKAITMVSDMNVAYDEENGKPVQVTNHQINLGLAIDMPKPDGTRTLIVPNIKAADQMNFREFWQAYEAMVKKARNNELTVDDFAGTTASLTNPGGIGTSHSVPRLMPGQGLILGVGSIDYPPEFQAASDQRIKELGVSKITTLTSTYDHRVIQGATSGEFLKVMHELIIGDHDFYDELYLSLRVPYVPLRWTSDDSAHRSYELAKGTRVLQLINAYRSWGHLMADIDPLEYQQRSHPELELEAHGLSIWDLEREFPVGVFGGHEKETMRLKDVLAQLRTAYCGHVGVEYMHIADTGQRRWVESYFESPIIRWGRDEHLRILDKLNEAEIFETFLQTKFVGQKRFSLEGAESTIVLLDEICDRAANEGLEEVTIGMPHRGRLNVLANIVGKSYGQIFREFEGSIDPNQVMGTGDVKYHLGAEGQFTSLAGRTVKTSVAANPSHLEAVNPVVEGIARAKMDAAGTLEDGAVLPVLLHGDASFSGQGIVYETLQMSQLRGYKTGGTIHIVVNNQVGFTTAPSESRSSMYCTDVGKAIGAPIFHVNGDDPEAVARVGRLAFEYRQRFNADVIIDLIAYRRRGHNEGDDPSFTQPKMYDLIEQKRSVRRLYTEALIGRGDISTDDAEGVMEKFRARLEGVFKEVKSADEEDDSYRKVPFYPAKLGKEQGTSITKETMQRIADAQVTYPEGFAVHPKVLPQMQRRAESIVSGPIDWATAELLALGSLLMEGRTVRLTGQDSRRGTFSQRFAAVVDRVTNEEYIPLKHLTEDQGQFHVFDSLLSEYAAMGFEYGYSVASPQSLVLWEGQFGDFANGAQTIADEFISSGDAKWTQKSGVTLLLPHGYEGQGPDHSSARIERWLQLCSEGALAVCQPSTPASHFHLLRTHTYVNWHRPLVIMTPKSMLRSKAAASPVEEFTDGKWRPAIGDASITDPSAVQTVILCSGKIRWELVAQRAKRGLEGKVAIVSLERLYPLPTDDLVAELERYPHVTDIRFVQDEPLNQGPWPFMALHLPEALSKGLGGREIKLRPSARPEASSPSVGLLKVHQAQEKVLLDQAFEGI